MSLRRGDTLGTFTYGVDEAKWLQGFLMLIIRKEAQDGEMMLT